MIQEMFEKIKNAEDEIIEVNKVVKEINDGKKEKQTLIKEVKRQMKEALFLLHGRKATAIIVEYKGEKYCIFKPCDKYEQLKFVRLETPKEVDTALAVKKLSSSKGIKRLR